MKKLILGDCLEKLKELETNSVDSIVTDPPYELGFMGKSWDNTGIANNKEMWVECLRVLKHGGHLLAFGGTRTYHRMTCAIEDAGFEVRDMIEWVYGSGFPKSLNIGKKIDQMQGNEREDLGKSIHSANRKSGSKTFGQIPSNEGERILTKGTSKWEGWGTALKPAHEPICMARKPLAEKSVAENCLKWGTGGINIDESRVAHQSEADRLSATPQGKVIRNNFAPGEGMEGIETNRPDTSLGRFPANLIHDNSEEVRECFPEANHKTGGKSSRSIGGKGIYSGGKEITPIGFNDSGNASRFFKSIIYQAKASKSERNRGCEELPQKEKRYMATANGTGETSKGMDRFTTEPVSNNHPTVKPTALMQYLIKMITPKGGTVLDPFMGSGSTGKAAIRDGFSFIGIEKEAEYFDIAKARIEAELKEKELEQPTLF